MVKVSSCSKAMVDMEFFSEFFCTFVLKKVFPSAFLGALRQPTRTMFTLTSVVNRDGDRGRGRSSEYGGTFKGLSPNVSG